MDKRKQHWEGIYSEKNDNEVSWFQKNPETSKRLIEKYAKGRKDISIADIGGGNSMLVSKLVKNDYADICVLDISEKALERSKARIKVSNIKWIASNILECNELKEIDIWHDRAVFHFLTNSNEINKYVAIATKAISINGYLILGTFSETGPDKCSGLPITKYSKNKFTELFSDNFDILECFEEIHTTPFGFQQNFIWAIFKKR